MDSHRFRRNQATRRQTLLATFLHWKVLSTSFPVSDYPRILYAQIYAKEQHDFIKLSSACRFAQYHYIENSERSQIEN
jgi:hypothetical protein